MLLGRRGVEARPALLASLGGSQGRSDIHAGRLHDILIEPQDGSLNTGTDIEITGAADPCRSNQGIGHIFNEHEVASLVSVTENCRPPPRDQVADEDRDDTGLTVRILPRPVHIREPERYKVKVVGVLVVPKVLLDDVLGHAVR